MRLFDILQNVHLDEPLLIMSANDGKTLASDPASYVSWGMAQLEVERITILSGMLMVEVRDEE